MKTLRWTASILVCGPVVACVGSAYGKAWSFAYVSAAAKTNAEVLSHGIRIALYSTALGILMFVPGVLLHALVAAKTARYSSTTWILILVMSALVCTCFPIGTVLGGVTLVLLFTLKTFRRMMNAERPARGDC